MTYLNLPFQNSEAYHSVVGATLEQLENRRPYAVMAVNFHAAEGNAEQVEFFKAELELIEKRIHKLEADK